MGQVGCRQASNAGPLSGSFRSEQKAGKHADRRRQRGRSALRARAKRRRSGAILLSFWNAKGTWSTVVLMADFWHHRLRQDSEFWRTTSGGDVGGTVFCVCRIRFLPQKPTALRRQRKGWASGYQTPTRVSHWMDLCVGHRAARQRRMPSAGGQGSAFVVFENSPAPEARRRAVLRSIDSWEALARIADRLARSAH